ncbi:hypothetical protein GGR32_000169 [Mesonia hippocampi]|uniref:ATP-binding protein n=1 Tax=Mesonia hippocampi TaxID=1628250 RepID=A0A840ESI0_9FLAO|nr:ATP-binding protein [Mesonia hippocampi]MBB4117897.1 hypothetical protein [Mesonia hippocampi]
MSNIPRAYSYTDIERKEFDVLPFTGIWKDHQGEPERAGSIIIYGGSGHGKTTYGLQFMKYLCGFEKVFYNTPEEGMKASFRRNLKLNGLQYISDKYNFQSEFYDDMVKRLSQKRQPKIVFVDSVQYCFRGKRDTHYFDLIEKFPNTLFVWISQMQKNAPKGSVADAIMWDAQNVIRVQDFKAYIEKTRCGGNETMPYVISQEKANERELKLLKKG